MREPVFNLGLLESVRTLTCHLMNGTPIYVSLSLSFVGARKPKSLLVSSSPNLDHSFSVDFDFHLRWRQDCYYKGDPISITPSSLSGFKADYVLFHRRTSKEEGKIEKDIEREEFEDEFKDDFSLDPVLNTVASTSLLRGSMRQHGFTQLYIRVRSSQAAQQRTLTCHLMNGTPIYVSLSLSFVGARKPKSLLVSSSPNLDHSFSVDFDFHLRWRQDCYYKGDPISITPSSLSGFKADYVLFHRRTSKEEGKIEKDIEREEFEDEFKDDFSLDPVLNTVASTSLLRGSMRQHGFTQLYIRVRSSQAAQQRLSSKAM
ncbi:hypothetical protein DY000_02051181 [Brassica cretica]|uniref:C2 NT-type domain-containing protein n=1 Tax=Brassica cretica TaxID=69181 RepID=A0ABQ7EP82_BRACR|nr:hypothetical protein DY000_02051181 [Brassica cretica]